MIPNEVWWIVWFMLGGCLGSFLNVCIYRMPREASIVFPGSRCPHCEKPIAWYDNLPLVSYVVLGGACRQCRASILWRYPVVEALTGVATVAVFERFGVTVVSLIYLAFVCALIVASFIDFEFQIIPDEISLGGLVIGLALSLALPALHGTDARFLAFRSSILGMAVGGGLLYGTGLLGDVVFRKESMGGGDIKLLAMAGSILGWKLVALTFFLAPMLALVPGLFVLLMKKSHVIPFGPFLSLGLIIALFQGDAILRATGMEETVRLLWSYYGWSHR